jgi:PilZ domain
MCTCGQARTDPFAIPRGWGTPGATPVKRAESDMSSSVLVGGELALPEEKMVVDVVGVQDGRGATGVVQEVSGDEIVLGLLPRDGRQPVGPEPGSRMELVWKDAEGLLAMLVEVRERAAGSVLRVRRAGPTAPGQRRGAVRSPLGLPVQVTRGKDELCGLTVDVSEGGLRCVLNLPDAETSRELGEGPVEEATGDGVVQQAAGKLAVGDRVTVLLTFDNTVVRSAADVVRRHGRKDGRVEVSVRFVGLPEVTEDLIRRHVFASLRDLRQRGLI